VIRRLVLLVVVLAACGDSKPPPKPASLAEKCARTFDRLEPFLEQAGKPHDRDSEIKQCLDTVTKSPSRVVWLDCILRIDQVTDDKVRMCEALDRQAIMSDPAARRAANVSGDSSASRYSATTSTPPPIQ
jgi:hypothetical protein